MLAAGTTLGPYRILTPLGAGGMGEVYRARDTRLARDVAVKVVRTDFARDPERLKRFEQEARAAGALNHPNVCTIFDVGTHDGAPFVVMELLEGESLRAKQRAGSIPLRKAIEYAAQVAHGLAAAHEKGIVHRDLKPENLFVTKDGRVKVLDFGLAKLTRPEVPASARDSTISVAATESGTIMGTAGYMAPEQLRGQAADARSDLFALGAIVHEMVGGKRAFKGESFVETAHAILNDEPAPLSSLCPDVPSALESLVRHCLEKEPAQRFQSARDLAFALEAMSGSGGTGKVVAEPVPRWRRWTMPAMGLALVAAVAVTYMIVERTSKALIPTYERVTFRRGTVSSARFTPDGRTIVYSARWLDRQGELYSQRLGTTEARALGLRGRILAASGGEMIFLHGDTLSRVSLEGGTPRDVLAGVMGADWSRDGNRIAVVREVDGCQQLEYPVGNVLFRAPTSTEILDSPRLSPRGDLIAVLRKPNGSIDDYGDVVMLDLSGRRTVLAKGLPSVGGLAWAPDGHEVWFSATRVGLNLALHAVTLSGRERILARMAGSITIQDVSADGRVILTHDQQRFETRGRMAGDSVERDLSWLDGTCTPRLSNDGTKMLFQEWGEGGGIRASVYFWKLDGSTPVRLGEGTPGSATPDWKWAVCLVGPPYRLKLIPIGAGDVKELPLGSLSEATYGIVCPDGKRMLVMGAEAGRPYRLFMQDLPDGVPRPFTPEGINIYSIPTSPDGRLWTARPPGPRAPYLLYSIDGGAPRPIHGLLVDDEPLTWSDDGRSLFIQPGGAKIHARVARLDTRTGRREPWLEVTPPDRAGVGTPVWALVSITPDGRHYAYWYMRNLSDLYLVDGLK